jgi:TPR repeat protein
MVGVLLDRAEHADPREATDWFHKAADQGHALAQFELGLRHDCGKGIERDYEAAHFWYLCAARQGHARAQFNLGVMYSAGQGVHCDLVEAYGWLQRAGGAGVAAASSYLKKIAARMEPQLLAQAQGFS